MPINNVHLLNMRVALELEIVSRVMSNGFLFNFFFFFFNAEPCLECMNNVTHLK